MLFGLLARAANSALDSERGMYFWRDKYFKTLTEAANYASAIPAWAEYAQFCELLERGLRKDAFTHLESFIESAAKWSLSERRKFVSWLYNFAYGAEMILTF